MLWKGFQVTSSLLLNHRDSTWLYSVFDQQCRQKLLLLLARRSWMLNVQCSWTYLRQNDHPPRTIQDLVTFHCYAWSKWGFQQHYLCLLPAIAHKSRTILSRNYTEPSSTNLQLISSRRIYDVLKIFHHIILFSLLISLLHKLKKR